VLQRFRAAFRQFVTGPARTAQLAAANSRLDLATQVAGLGIFVWDRTTNRIVSETLRNYAMFGRTPSDPPLSLEEFVLRFVHPEDRPDFEERLRASLGTGEPLRAVCRIRRQNDGQWRWLEIAGTFEPHPGGVPQRLIGVLRDITDVQQRQDALRDRNETLRLAMRGGRMGAWVRHLTDDTVEWSHELEELFGVPHGAFGGTEAAFFDFVHPEDRAQIATRARRAIADRTDYTIEFRFRHASGEWRWMEGRGQAIYDDAGRPLHLYGIGIDITERRRAEEQLREADRRKDEFLATLAHELRNPLAPIRNAVQYMNRPDATGPALKNAREIIDRQVRHMVRLVDDLLEVSRITSGRIELEREHVSLDIAVGNAVEASQPAIQAGEHHLEVSLPSTPVYLDADLTRLSQVLLNLLNNAAKYTPPKGRIALTATQRDGWVSISVRDNGIGIPQEQLPRIFDLFVQLGRHTNHTHGGLGIGLTLARQLTRLHGGEVEARSEGPGRGSEFIVRLPVAPAPAHDVLAPGEVVRPEAQRERLLIVDDNVDAADALRMNLEQAGYTVRVTHSGTDAMAAFREMQPEVVVLDLGLPDISGVDVARAIRGRREGRDVVLVALTGWGRDEDRARTTEAGFDEHLTKPVDALVLLQVIAMHRREPQSTP
jgi:PAS domain S-box-containing protein